MMYMFNSGKFNIMYVCDEKIISMKKGSQKEKRPNTI